MARSSISGADRAPTQAEGRDTEALGPSDSSDSGSDVQGELDLASPVDPDNMTFGTRQPGLEGGSDAAGTGERGSALPDEEGREGGDILPDDVRSLQEEADAAENLSLEAELELSELTDAGDIPSLEEEEDKDEDNG